MSSTANDRYYVPNSSHWPIVGSIGLLFLMVGVSSWLNGADAGFYIMLGGFAIIVFMLVGWFSAVIGESVTGLYNDQVDKSFRQGMFWFIFSEVMFFAAFFGALFYARNMSIPWLGGDSNNFFTNLLLWEGYESTWPSNGPGNIGGDYERAQLSTFLALTFILGFVFVYLQGVEYVEAYEDFNLKMTSGIYGSTFFMLTGFHGMHVSIGAIMITVIWFRVLKGHFSAGDHFAFEAVAWYWHFVDVVWVGLYVFVYWM
jgi:cytochrome c oxidase subunit 3